MAATTKITTDALGKVNAEKIASTLGTTLDKIQIDSGNRTSTSKVENQHPSKSTIAGKIKLITYGGVINNNNIIVEKYYIKPNFVGLQECDGPQSGIYYLPIPNSVYALKFYAPDDGSPQYYNMVYCVPCKADATYFTGYKDYLTGVPQEFIDAFVSYASTLPNNNTPKVPSAVPNTNMTKTFSSTEAIQKVDYTFSYWGSVSGTVSKASTFSFNFNFYPGQAPSQPSLSRESPTGIGGKTT